MDLSGRVKHAINRHLEGRDRPWGFGRALRHGLFPGGARVRPSLALGVALSCGDDRPAVADGLAAAVEFLHCASLVHDDMPCFDDAPLRRGQPSVHAAFGEATAVLVGDGLIVLAFQALADVAPEAGERLGSLLGIVSEAAGTPRGLVAGQAMESEESYGLTIYHAAKTGALFEAAAAGGAVAAGGDADVWRAFGSRLGAAYQIADDIRDRTLTAEALGKPADQDARLGRPNAVDAHGLVGAVRLLKHQMDETLSCVPEIAEARALRHLIEAQAARFVPGAAAPA